MSANGTTRVGNRCACIWLIAAAALFLPACGAHDRASREQGVLRALRTGSPARRRAALLRLDQELQAEAVQKAVQHVLSSDVDPAARALAAGALGRSRRRVFVEELRLSARTDTSWVVRERALRALTAILGEEAAQDIESALRDDPHPTVRVSATVLAASTLAPPRAARLILEGLRDPSTVVRLSARRWLVAIVGPLDIPPGDYERWKEAIDQCTQFQDVRRQARTRRPASTPQP